MHGERGKALALDGLGIAMRRSRQAVAAAMILALAGPVAAEDCEMDARDIFSAHARSVVQVLSISVDPFRVIGRTAPRTGTGFLFAEDLVATNYHVVADSADMVVFSDAGPHFAMVIGIDPALDIAVLELFDLIPDAAPLVVDPDVEIAVGEPVVAIGYPLGIGKSVSAGIVSGRNRIIPLTTSSWLVPFLQTDAAISPGNSGGPLFNACGHVIGMNTLTNPEAENLGFAIPVGVLAPLLAELADTGKVARPWHGLYGQMAGPPVLRMLGVPYELWEGHTGFLVETVEPGSAADRAGLLGGSWPAMWGGSEILLGGDIVTHVNGVRIDTMDKALGALQSIGIGETVEIVALRDGEAFTRTVTIDERPLLADEMALYRNHR